MTSSGDATPDRPLTPASPDWAARLRELGVAEPGTARAELHRLGDAVRALHHAMVRTAAPVDVIASVADAVEATAAALAAEPMLVDYDGFSESANAGSRFGFFDRSPMLGRANPLAPPLDLWEEDGRIVGRAVFGAAYEGPPGCVHGGYIAAAFDELLGSTESLSKNPGMTGRLMVHYRSPTPLETELRFEGVLDRVEGRKIFTTGSIWADDRLCATAEGLFISLDATRFAELRALRTEALTRGVVGPAEP
jgi:acyl-coenzyme A thioesterase PaaI-like protein